MNAVWLSVIVIIAAAAEEKFIENSREWITAQHLKVLSAIVSCRTADLSWHFDECTDCGYSGYAYNSCRNSSIADYL
jgi:hypothetical protein